MKVSDLVYSWSNRAEIPQSVQRQLTAMRQNDWFGDSTVSHNLEVASLMSIADSLDNIGKTLSDIERKIYA